MDFSKLLLGYQEIEDLIKLAIKEKYITSFTNDYQEDFGSTNHFKNIEDTNDFIANSRIFKKSSLLRTIMLYDNIDSNRWMPFDISRLVDCGLFSENAIMNNDNLTNRPICNMSLKMSENEEFNHKLFVEKLFIEIDRMYNIDSFFSFSEHEIIKLSEALSKVTQRCQARSFFSFRSVVKMTHTISGAVVQKANNSHLASTRLLLGTQRKKAWNFVVSCTMIHRNTLVFSVVLRYY